MFTAEQYRAKASEYAKLMKTANGPNEVREYQSLERSFTELVDNAMSGIWLFIYFWFWLLIIEPRRKIYDK